MLFRQSPRLKTFDYIWFRAYFITSVTRARAPYFGDADVLSVGESKLEKTAREFDFRLLSYCFMPDHCHLLVVAEAETCDLEEFVRQFKQQSSFNAKKITGEELWQISFWDRVVRNDEDLALIANYIWHNPVRANIVSDFREYGGSGPKPLADDLG